MSDGRRSAESQRSAVPAPQPSPVAPDEAIRTGGADDKVIELDSIGIEVVGRDSRGRPEQVTIDSRQLFDDGNAAMVEQQFDDALALYRKLLETFPDSRLAPAARYNSGLAHEGKGEYEAAFAVYRVLAADKMLDRDAIDAHMRIAAVQAELERWADSAATLRAILGRRDLTHADRLEAMARLGYAYLEQTDYGAAESVLRDAIDYYRRLTTALDSNYFIAMSYYYLAQVAHRRFHALPVRLPEEQVKSDLATKAERVATAYDLYVEALQLHHAYWSTAAGYQMSQIYKELWEDMVLAPVPDTITGHARAVYIEEIHRRGRELLQRAMTGHSKNVELAEAYKTPTVWSDASRVRAVEIADILARETRGELVTPKPRPRTAAESSGGSPTVGHEYIPVRVDL
ncbi:MAG: tetratricopeptide repeat protein [Myxococcota bacterium]